MRLALRRAWLTILCVLVLVETSACDVGVLVHDIPDASTDGSAAVSFDALNDVISITDVIRDRGPLLCVVDDDCAGHAEGTHCERATGQCRECSPAPNSCGPRAYCDAMFHCVSGCQSDPDCAGGPPRDGGIVADGGVTTARCDLPRHACVECLGDPDCPGALVCQDNRCRMGCSDMRPCPSGSDCCGGACFDLLADNAHCGSCAHACETGETCCGGVCFNVATDARHCGSCSTRCSLPNASAACRAGSCVPDVCTPGRGDCDGDATNGCETDVTRDPAHCGTCATLCPTGTHTTASCTSGICSSTCAIGFQHCSSNPLDGCESSVASDLNHCGRCGHVCTSEHASGACTGGRCTIASCNPGFRDCDSLADNGCESDTTGDAYNCGACFRVCPTGPFSTPLCAAGTCSVRCNAGFGDCDAAPGNGCESDFSSDLNHCGSCSTVCPRPANAFATCVDRTCGYTCNVGMRDCDERASNGCEVNAQADVNNCGGCGAVCAPAHASPTCTTSGCGIRSCDAGFANCNGLVADGCETSTTADSANCGGCFNSCPSAPFATATCGAGACGIACIAGHADCDGIRANGCEVALASNAAHCGSCATVCPARAGASAVCAGSVCGFSCASGFSNCNGVAGDGCETNLLTSAANCGACGDACVTPRATAVCASGGCQVGSCNAGYANCDGASDNGCETPTTADVLNCGACLRVCLSGANATPRCAAGSCSITCATGYGDCNALPADGCETSFTSDPLHCGSCATICPTRPNTVPTCTASACGFICQPAFVDCNTTAADGCEINVRTNINNCGSCGTVCSAPGATAACSSGNCVIAACSAGYSDCNGIYSDGCETHTAIDSSNCGACGTVCSGGTICVSGACALVNPFPSTGAEGAFNPVVNTVIVAAIHHYTTINIPLGVTVTTNGDGVLDLRTTGDITVAGTIDVTGGAGGAGSRVTGGGGGGATGSRTTGTTGTPGVAGLGGRSPAGAASTGCVRNSPGGGFGGGAGSYGVSTLGGGGGGPGGGGGGLIGGACNGGVGGGGASAGAGGQAGGAPYDGAPGQSGFDVCGGLAAGGGGASIGAAAVSDLGMATTFVPGSGGGGGSASYGTGLSAAEGGGGGGGGALRLSSPTRITVSGTLRADGGVGGNGSDGNTTCFAAEGGAGGGGGSGGAIYLASPIVTVTGTANAVGGSGGTRGANVSGGDGGRGGLGRIRFSVSPATCTVSGAFNPPLRSGCAVTNSAGFAYIAGYPR